MLTPAATVVANTNTEAALALLTSPEEAAALAAQTAGQFTAAPGLALAAQPPSGNTALLGLLARG